MAHVTASVRLFQIPLVVAMVHGCNGTTPAAPDQPAVAPVEAKQSVAEATTRGCPELAQALCERLPVGCDAALTLLSSAATPDSACRDARETLVTIDDLPPDMRALAHVVLLEELMRSSPRIGERPYDEKAHARTLAFGATDRAPPRYGEVICPGVSTRKGAVPPTGDEVWCEKPNGTRHGKASKWNDKGELVRTGEHRDGKLIEVEYHEPASGELPIELFVCPADARRIEEQIDGLEVRACDTNGHRGIVAGWKAGKLVRLDVEADPADPMADHFFAGMPVPH